MTKEQLIERYGIEWYEAYKAHLRDRYANNYEFRKAHLNYYKERYVNNSEFREAKKARNNTNCKERYIRDIKFKEIRKIRGGKARYVKDGRIDLVENYGLAKADNFKGWCMHHRLELHPDNSVRFTKTSLLKLGLYYNRPPTELIWVTSSEHNRMHSLGRKHEKGKA